MQKGINKLVNAFIDKAMTRECRANVLGYAKGRLDAQKELAYRDKKAIGKIKENSVIKGGDNEKDAGGKTFKL